MVLNTQGAVEARNANYASIVRNLQFTKSAWFGLRLKEELDDGRQRVGHDSDTESGSEAEEELEGVEQASKLPLQLCMADLTVVKVQNNSNISRRKAVQCEQDSCLMQGQGMRDAEMVVWLGDFNYRLDTTFENAKEKARRHMLAELLELVHELCCLCATNHLFSADTHG